MAKSWIKRPRCHSSLHCAAKVPGLRAIIELGKDECTIDVFSCSKGEHLFHMFKHSNLLRDFSILKLCYPRRILSFWLLFRKNQMSTPLEQMPLPQISSGLSNLNLKKCPGEKSKCSISITFSYCFCGRLVSGGDNNNHNTDDNNNNNNN